MRQVEVSRTLVFDDPRRARGFFESLVPTTSASGGPKRSTPCSWPDRRGRTTAQPFATRVFAPGTEVKMDFRYKHSRVKQYLKEGRALRIETVINKPADIGVLARLGPIVGVPFPVAFRPPASASRVIRCPPGDWAFLAVGLPGHVTAPGPRRDYHVPHARDATGVGASCISRAAVLTRLTKNPRPAPAVLQRPAPPPRLPHAIRRGSRITRHQRRFTQFTRPVCPLPVTPRWNRGPSAFPWASHPAVTSDARQGRGQAFEHGPGTTPPA